MLLLITLIVIHESELDVPFLRKIGLRDPLYKPDWSLYAWDDCLKKMDYDAEIVFFGDSITRESDFRTFFPDKTIVNLGLVGDTLTGMLNRVSMISSVFPEKIFLLGGINELKDDNFDACVANYEMLVDKIQAAVPDAALYIQSVLPISSLREYTICHNTTIQQFNLSIQKLAKEKNCQYINLFDLFYSNGELSSDYSNDGLHINDEAYRLWAGIIEEYVKAE